MRITKFFVTSVLFLVIFIISISNISAVEHTHVWSKRLGSPDGSDGAKIIKSDTNGNTIVLGYTGGDADLNGDGDTNDSGGEDSSDFGNHNIIISSFDSEGVNNWYKRVGSTSASAWDLYIDQNDNIYVAIAVTGDADLNGDGDTNDGNGEDSTGYGAGDAAILSFDANGTYRWSKRLGGTGNDLIQKISKTTDDNLILAGGFTGNADLNGDGDSSDGGAETSPGLGGSQDFAYTVFDLSGTYKNISVRLASSQYSFGQLQFELDSNNNAVISASVWGDADLNGDGDTNDGNGEDSTGYGNYDLVISVFNSSGGYQWSKRLGGTSGDSSNNTKRQGVAIRGDNYVVVTGRVTGDADLNGDGDTNDGNGEDSTGYGSTDIFVSVFNSSGGYQWSKRLGGTGLEGEVHVAIDSSDRIILGGEIINNADLNGDGDTNDGNGEDSTGYAEVDIFLSVFNSSGTYQWSKRLGGDDWNDDEIIDLSLDSLDNIYLAGYISYNGDLNGDGDFIDTDFNEEAYGTDGFPDGIVSVFDSAGNAQWGLRFGGEWDDEVSSIFIDSSNNIYLAGQTSDVADLNGDGDQADDGESYYLGYYDIYLAYFEYQAPTVVIDDPVTTSTVVAGEETIQIPASSSVVSQNIVSQPIKDSNTGGQDILGIIQPGTIIFDAYLSSNLVSRPSQIINLSNIPSNIVIGGNDAIIGIKSFFTTYWQVGNIQQMWLKTYPPAGHSAAIVVRELQEKPSIVAFKYTDEHLKPIGRPNDRYNPKYFKIAYSLDGVNWKVLNNSVVDTTNKTVAVIDEIGGYYVLVNK
jgi:hypothetical protein